MAMKRHILAALQEQFERWEALLAGLAEPQITAPRPDSSWSLKDDVAHLWAWQQRSIARVEAARRDGEPEYPDWPASLDPDSEDATQQLNTWLYETNRGRPWSDVHQTWREGYLRFIEGAQEVSERDLLDGSRYAWLDGRPLALVLLASYDHHQEHLEQALASLRPQSGEASDAPPSPPA
jgi:hypothetical protein